MLTKTQEQVSRRVQGTGGMPATRSVLAIRHPVQDVAIHLWLGTNDPLQARLKVLQVLVPRAGLSLRSPPVNTELKRVYYIQDCYSEVTVLLSTQ